MMLKPWRPMHRSFAPFTSKDNRMQPETVKLTSPNNAPIEVINMMGEGVVLMQPDEFGEVNSVAIDVRQAAEMIKLLQQSYGAQRWRNLV